MTPAGVLWLLGIIAAVLLSTFFYLFKEHRTCAICVGLAFFVVVSMATGLFLRNDRLEDARKADQPTYFGYLIPGNEPGLELPGGVPENTITLLLGDNLAVLTARSDGNYIFSREGEPFLSMAVGENGMLITTTVLDSTNSDIVKIIDNEFKASNERAFNPKQPDEYSLVVRDSEGIEVLNIRFLNPDTMRITGRFHIPGYSDPLLILPAEGVVFPGGKGGISNMTVDMTASPAGFIGF